MTEKKKSKKNSVQDQVVAESAGLSSYKPDPIREQVRSMEGIVRNLKKDIDHFRGQCNSLQKERNDLAKTVRQLEETHFNPAELENQLRLSNDDCSRLHQSLQRAQDECRIMKQSYSEMEIRFIEEKRKREEAVDIIVCLEAQIEQLEAIINTLKDHNSFMYAIKK